MAIVQKITPCLWFDNTAKEAMDYYVSVFPEAKIGHVQYYPDESLDEHFVGMSGKVITGEFYLHGQKFICLDGAITGRNCHMYLSPNSAAGAKTGSV